MKRTTRLEIKFFPLKFTTEEGEELYHVAIAPMPDPPASPKSITERTGRAPLGALESIHSAATQFEKATAAMKEFDRAFSEIAPPEHPNCRCILLHNAPEVKPGPHRLEYVLVGFTLFALTIGLFLWLSF